MRHPDAGVSWLWVDREMDDFDKRSQDPYVMTDEQRAFVREKIFRTGRGSLWKKHSCQSARGDQEDCSGHGSDRQ